LHHILCAAWNGDITVNGDEGSPESVAIHLGVSVQLDLQPYGQMSSWGSLLGAYEEWVLREEEKNEEGIKRDFCSRLMTTLPNGVSTAPSPPGPVFTQLAELAAKEPDALQSMLSDVSESNRRRIQALNEFWSLTFPAALDHQFSGTADPVRDNLRELVVWVNDTRRG